MESPAAAKTVTPASTRYLRKVTQNSSGLWGRSPSVVHCWNRVLCLGRLGRSCRFGVLLHHLVAGSAQFQKRLGFFVKTAALIPVKRCFPQDAENSLRSEIIFIIKTVHRREDLIGRQTRVLNMGELMPALVDHLAVGDHEAVLHGVVVKLGTGIGMGHGN